MSDELKPCPFCGSEAGVSKGGRALCSNEDCIACELFAPVEDWNRRAQPAEAEVAGEWEWLKLAAEVAEEDGPWDPRIGMTDCETAFAQSASPTRVLELIAALSAVTAERDRLRALIAECAEYLNTDRETTIGSGSILHRQMIAAMAAKEA